MIESTEQGDGLFPLEATARPPFRTERIGARPSDFPERSAADFPGASGRQFRFLQTLWCALDAGITWTTVPRLERRGHELAEASDPRVRAYLADVVAKHRELMDIEDQHGLGAALELRHPVVQGLMRTKRSDGTIVITELMAERARLPKASSGFAC